jgi:hypothetical protein
MIETLDNMKWSIPSTAFTSSDHFAITSRYNIPNAILIMLLLLPHYPGQSSPFSSISCRLATNSPPSYVASKYLPPRKSALNPTVTSQRRNPVASSGLSLSNFWISGGMLSKAIGVRGWRLHMSHEFWILPREKVQTLTRIISRRTLSALYSK